LAPEATTVADLMGKSAAELKQTVQEVDRADFAVKKEQEKSPESRGKSFNEDIAERIEARLVKGELTFNMMPDGSLVIAAPDVAELHQTYRRDYL
jgi:hypothetical protein